GADALVSAAAIGDYTVEKREGKIKSGQDDLNLELTPTPKLLDSVRDRAPALPMIGFKLEADADDEALTAAARELLSRVDLSLVVANDAGAAGGERTRALLVGPETRRDFEGTKAALGGRIAEEIVEMLT
ncbi:MAG: phosphopantothenoylcysteine decarboxylase, partial [Haloferacaceae archaeon]